LFGDDVQATDMDDLIRGIVGIVFEEFCATTGRWLLGRFGRRPHHLVCVFTGFAFWIVFGMLAYAALHR